MLLALVREHGRPDTRHRDDELDRSGNRTVVARPVVPSVRTDLGSLVASADEVAVPAEMDLVGALAKRQSVEPATTTSP